MLSCHDLYHIEAQLSKIYNNPDLHFGGLNIIFAGDFAQLPPALGGEKSSIGKALWHQVTTVVILRQNMRQQAQSQQDSKLRTALENIFRNVSIITAWNNQKDHINELGCERFASDTKQELTVFFSEDLRIGDDESTLYREVKKRKIVRKKTYQLSRHIQEILWSLSPHTSDHFASKLKLCIGMPVIIRHNDATELCITNGQEGTVAGWVSSIGSQEQQILDILFVQLINPPSEVAFEGLPINVVPIPSSIKDITCILPNDEPLHIKRQQVQILPNFAMTDYAAQGKTRLSNVVDLQHCQSHQSYYTALSQSASADGTAIIQGLDTSKITGGASGWLRKEFRELEILDHITELDYVDKILSLKNTMNGKGKLLSLLRHLPVYTGLMLIHLFKTVPMTML
ncbi:hypothetical protein BDN67DRAFT_991735 [Paxillus ammoniavirescens]|nr:hypothetical protein BDN67DRAFT_991735 [Paxillus ammoniavirescens]